MGTCKSYVLLAFSAVLISKAWAGGKTVDGLTFQLSPQPKVPCLIQPFQIWHAPDVFFKGLKQVTSKGTLQYRRGHDIVANFPDSTTVIVELWQGLRGFISCSTSPAFDPARVKFHVEWKNDSHTVSANGKFVVSEESSPQTWCEDNCAARWTYELRIDSEGVPLQDSIVVRIETEDGTRLAEYVGKLSTEKLEQQQPRRRRDIVHC